MQITDVLSNLDLLSVAIVIASTCVIGFTVFFSNRNSATNQAFFAFALVTAIWGTVNYFAYQVSDANAILMLLRFILFFAVWQAFFLFELFHAFPQEHPAYTHVHRTLLLPLVAITSLITVSPLTFSHIVIHEVGTVSDPDRGPGLFAFGFVAVSLVIAALYALIQKLRKARKENRSPFVLLLIGTAVSFALIITFNFLVPVLTHDRSFVPLGALFMFPLIATVGYTILRHKLFNVKVAGVSLLVFALAVVTFGEVILTNDLALMIYRSAILLLVLAFGVLLIRGVTREVELREKIEKQEKELEIANREQESLLHFMSHEVKGYLTESEAGFAAIAEGDYGAIPEKLESMAHQALASVRRGVSTVMEILDASNFKKGTVRYEKTQFDFRAAIRAVVDDLKEEAAKKGLTIHLDIGEGSFLFEGDEEKLKQHVIRNLIDNAIKYTPKGAVKVALTDGTSIRFSVHDSGIGITPEDMEKLFTEGGHGKDSIKVNVHSTGYGLYIAKRIVEAHGGKIWAESEGHGKGSTFIIEFPIAK